MVMIVSIPMVMNNRGAVNIQQTQVLDSKSIDTSNHFMVVIIMIVMAVTIVIVTMSLERFCCNHTIGFFGEKLARLDILKPIGEFSLADQNILPV
tara:strand:+ start:1509 stop:1793 length:285 start_codon:yes stop_codon:yes gene_type:complete